MLAYIATDCWFEERVGDGGWKHTNPDASTQKEHTPGFPLCARFSLLTCHFLPRRLPGVTHRRASHRDNWLLMRSLPTWLPFLTVIHLLLCHQLKTIVILLASSPDCWYSVISTLSSCAVSNKYKMRFPVSVTEATVKAWFCSGGNFSDVGDVFLIPFISFICAVNSPQTGSFFRLWPRTLSWESVWTRFTLSPKSPRLLH